MKTYAWKSMSWASAIIALGAVIAPAGGCSSDSSVVQAAGSGGGGGAATDALENWGMPVGRCNAAGPFTLAPALSGAGCNGVNLHFPKQPTLCFK